ncbi:hypothetical protein H0A65_00965 [Alcaligenaceae bacterium]|nr:hypothetical protein [Alcaligenaceae bacterium]
MSIRTISRCSLVLGLATLVSACSMLGFGDSSDGTAQTSNACKWNRSSCMYEGRYEAGERDYAEEEARRLNQASAAKLRRNAVR